MKPRFPPGVHRHRTLLSMNELQDAWTDANFTAYQKRLEEWKADGGAS
jgi:hypothetical protein